MQQTLCDLRAAAPSTWQCHVLTAFSTSRASNSTNGPSDGSIVIRAGTCGRAYTSGSASDICGEHGVQMLAESRRRNGRNEGAMAVR